MVSRLVAVTMDAAEPRVLGAFWAALLGREAVVDRDCVWLPGDDVQVGLRFARAATDRRAPAYLHLHLTSSSAADQANTVEAALRLGAHHVDVGQRPEEGHVVLADPEDN